MITMHLPHESQRLYLRISLHLLGPFSANSSAVPSTFEYRSRFDSLWQKRGIYYENFVDNLQAKGDISLLPLYKKVVSSTPDPGYPDKVAVDPLYLYGTTSPTKVTVSEGIASDTTVSMYNSGGIWAQTAIIFPTSRTISKVCVRANKTASGQYFLAGIDEDIYTIPDVIPSGTTLTLTRKSRSAVFDYLKVPLGYDWAVRQPYDIVRGFLSKMGLAVYAESQLSGVSVFSDNSPYSENVENLKSLVDNTLVKPLVGKEFPIVGKHEGTLAQEASEKFNANSVNMIAFIRDLRNPKELIPKLQNLRSLKTLANNYLTVEYGILPTIDDLKSIVSAMKGARPYFDRNGYATFSAGHAEESVDSEFRYRLEQHVKLAISSNEDTFERLLNRIESAGFFPTFENIWDLIPYSFVIDWFVDVGGLLASVDSSLRIERYNIRYATISRKETTTVTLKPSITFPYSGTVDWVHYHRWPSGQCPVPPLSLETTFQDFDHWLESGALLVQRSKLIK